MLLFAYQLRDPENRMPWKPASHAQRQGRSASDQRANANRLMHDPRKTARWQRLRQLILARVPLCCDPFGWHAREGRLVPATQVDHIRGVRTHPELVFALENLRAVCTGCHAQLSAIERQSTAGYEPAPGS
jgi:hypothetical protein